MAQATSIFEIADWALGAAYNKWDIVKQGDYYYYATVDHTASASDFNLDYSAGKWDGVATGPNGVIKPKFLWNPVYTSPILSEPKIRKIQFGDGYEQRAKEGINNNLISLDCSFAGKSLQEATALIHFLYAREGIGSFLYTPMRPFNIQKLFKCEKYTVDQQFYDNFTITATFNEVVN